MKFRGLKRWKDLENLRPILFFAQRMEELTFEYSIDSYRAPTTNPPYLARELLDELAHSRNEGFESNNYEKILDELELRLSGNPIVKNLIKLNIDRYIKPDRGDKNKLISLFSVLSDELEPRHYVEEAMRQLKQAVASSTPEKSKIDFLARELVTTLINIGMSPRHIKETTVKSFFNSGCKISMDSLSEYFNKIFPYVHQFSICFKIKSVADSLDDELLSIFDIEFTEDLPEIFSKVETSFKKLGLVNGQKYALVSINGHLDAYSAIKYAEANLARLHGLFAIYHHKDTYELDQKILIEQCCQNGIRELEREPNRMMFISDHRPLAAAGKFTELLKNLNFPNGTDRDKFFRVVDFHSMSLSTDILENQLLNIWISLETITPTATNKTKIENITESVTPFISVKYLNSIFKQLLYDLNNWNAGAINKQLAEMRTESKSDKLVDLFRLVVFDEHESKRNRLYSELKDFELLRYRIFRLNASLSSPIKILHFIESHNQRVKWQIRRIYRTRNQIVHSGNTPEFTGQLVENAHVYFDQVFDTCCELGSNSKGFSNFHDVFNFIGWVNEDHCSWIRKLEKLDEKDAARLLYTKASDLPF